jgi:hypothetical protein
LRSSCILTTWTGRMASVGAGHGNPLSTLSKNVETSHHRSKVSQLSSSGQHWPLLGLFLLAPIFPASSQWSIEALQRANFYPVSLLHYTSLSRLLWLAPSLLPLVRFLTWWSPLPHWSLQVSLALTDSYITSNPSACGLFIILMMHAIRTSGNVVFSSETTWHYIPEDSLIFEMHCVVFEVYTEFLNII